jgi:release factor glutamine methyltransferase
MPMPNDPGALAALLSGAGFVAAQEEAGELLACAAGDVELLDALVGRRLTGEPLAWITGSVLFCGLEIRVDPGVYVPRWQSEALARRAVGRLPARGAAIDLCTGAGAIARTLISDRPGARVVASDVDEHAVACATANGVEVYRGDLFAPLPRTLEERVDVVVGVVPYVPTPELPLLQRDTLTFESPLSYDGGRDGTEILRRVLSDSPRFLRRGGALLLELGGDQADALGGDLARLGYIDVTVLVDEEGDVRGLEATLGEADGVPGHAAERLGGAKTLGLAGPPRLGQHPADQSRALGNRGTGRSYRDPQRLRDFLH